MRINLDSQVDRDDDAVVRALKACNIAVTRENYIRLIYGDEPPENWSAELEGHLPKYLQDWSRLDKGTTKRVIKKPGRRKRNR
jgi:hypothetical protein